MGLVVAMAILLGTSPPLRALMVGISTEALTDEAESVVLGEVERVESRWDGRGRIVTDVWIRVDETLKNGVGPSVVLTHPGGTVGDVGMRVSDTPSFQPGERVLCFVHGADASGARRLVGDAQGKYRIGADGWARKSEFAVGPGAERVDWALPLDALRAKVRARVEGRP
jgi:hypothetical protein